MMEQPATNQRVDAAKRYAHLGCLLPLIIFLILAVAFVLGALYEYRQVRQAERQHAEQTN